jgi:hypothetical protein
LEEDNLVTSDHVCEKLVQLAPDSIKRCVIVLYERDVSGLKVVAVEQ